MNLIINTFWLFLPAAAANMAPVLFNRLPFLDIPVDFNKQFRGKPLFGPHKTYRGFFVGLILAILIVYLQRLAYPWPHGHTLVDYSTINFWLLGFLMAVGALGGDLVKSFFKRRLNMPSGWVWAPFDQIDWVVGAILLSWIIVPIHLSNAVVAIIMFGALHPIANIVGYLIKLKPNKF